MSYDHHDLKLEVEIFEKLEVKTHLTLGEINQLRRLSRQQNTNLLFLAYNQQHIDSRNAQEVAKELGIDTNKAPWMQQQSPRKSSGYITLNQRREEYNKTNQFAPAFTPPPPVIRPKRKTHQNIHAKTEIEINIPQTIEEREWSNVKASLSSESDQFSSQMLFPEVPALDDIMSSTHIQQNQVSSSAISPSAPSQSNTTAHHSFEQMNLPNSSISSQSTPLPLAQNTTQPHPPSSSFSEEENTPPQGIYISQVGLESQSVGIQSEIVSTENRWQVQPYPIHKWGQSSLTDTLDIFMQWEVYDALSQQTFHLITVHEDYHVNDSYHQLNTLNLSSGVSQLIWSDLREETLFNSLPQNTHTIYAFKAFKGRKLKQLIIENKQSSWKKRAMILWQIAYVMYQAHSRKVIHGNLSINGIWHTQDHIQIGYWECAVSTQNQHTQESNQHIIFDADYTAPEVLAGQAVNEQSDVYSLGAIAFYLLTGHTPPKEPYLQEQLINKHPQASNKWVKACLDSLSINPQQRPKSSLEFYRLLFTQDPAALDTSDTEKNTLELDLAPKYTGLYLSQILFSAGLSLQNLYILTRQGILKSEHNEIQPYYFPLMPNACLIISNLTQAQSVSIRALGNSISGSSIHEERSFHTAGIYHLTWTIHGSLMQWQISLQPLETKTFQLFGPSIFPSIQIPGGLSYIGSQYAQVHEQNLHAKQIDSFKISSLLVSYDEYSIFLESCTPSEQQQHQPLESNYASKAITGISYNDMMAYCAWRGGIRLPHEVEWERCLRGESDIELLTHSKMSILQDFDLYWGELCINHRQNAVIKGGTGNQGFIGKSQLVNPHDKLNHVGFRVVYL